MIEEAAFKSNFVGRDGFRWFIAQVAPSTKQLNKEKVVGAIDIKLESWGIIPLMLLLQMKTYHMPMC